MSKIISLTSNIHIKLDNLEYEKVSAMLQKYNFETLDLSRPNMLLLAPTHSNL